MTGHAIVRGQLQISMPSDLGRNVILPWLDDFQERYPDIHLRIQLSDRLADVFRQPVNIAIRYGKPPDSGLVALPLVKENNRVLCAAPAYLAEHGTPLSPEQLVEHNCLCFMVGESIYNRWHFRQGEREVAIDVQGNRISDDADAVRHWAITGHGVCYRSRMDVVRDISAGRLHALCTEWQGDNVPLYLVCADRRQLSPTVRLLHEFLEVRCRDMVTRST